MTRVLEFFSLPVSPAIHQARWLAFLVEMTLKGTIVLVAAFAVSTALRRASAAVRHLVWTTALGAVLVLPLLSLTLPVWRVALPQAATVVTAPGPAGNPALAFPSQPPQNRATAPLSPAEAAPELATWPAWTLLVWTVGFAFVLARLALGTARVDWMARRATKVDGADTRDIVRALGRQLGASPHRYGTPKR
jgi:beta-lactamase regulating signal transducer with metallopeptidase domain